MHRRTPSRRLFSLLTSHFSLTGAISDQLSALSPAAVEYARPAPGRRRAGVPSFSVLTSQFPVLLLLCALAGCQAPFGSGISTRHETVTIPTYEWGPHDINPHFEPTAGMSIYPYPMQDNLGREKKDKAYEALVLENEYLRVTVLPELGGHVHSVFDKTTGREMFYVNKVVKPGLIGMTGAWISGGIEFNTGPLGHTVTAVYPVACRFVEHDDGSKSIAIGHVERIYRTQWMAEVRLRPGRKFLEERIRLFNPNSTPQWYYFWNCTAVPNTDGTQFIYPMKLGTDHGYNTFFPWPAHDGKDYSWSKNYDAPTGPFAYECDQDFFGSYDHDIDFGIVATANHHQVKGKKGWTWGRGQDGIVAMSTLTDDGSWYNEVQTGPLQTQVDVAPFGPHQTIEWKEWWYPLRGMDGFEFATKDVAINVFPQVPFNGEAMEPVREIRIAATGRFSRAECVVSKDGRELLRRSVKLDPRSPALFKLPDPLEAPIKIEIVAAGQTLASFVHPLPLADRKAPEKPAKDESAPGIWREGIREQSNGNIAAARAKYEESLKKQADFVPAIKSLATMDLDSGLYERAAQRLEPAIRITPEDGLLHYYLAEAAMGMDDDTRALAEAWKAARISDTAAIGLNLAAQIYIRDDRWPQAEDALRQALRRDGEDLSSWNLLALVLEQTDRRALAIDACNQVLIRNPLDPHADGLIVHMLGWPKDKSVPTILAAELRTNALNHPEIIYEAIAQLVRLHQYDFARQVLCVGIGASKLAGPLMPYHAAGLHALVAKIESPLPAPMRLEHLRVNGKDIGPVSLSSNERESDGVLIDFNLQQAALLPLDYVFPDRLEEIKILSTILKSHPEQARVWYLLGNVLFSKHRFDEARQAWDKAAELNLQYGVLYRNIGLAKDQLDKDLPGATVAYEKAHALNPHDQTVLRDLARLYKKQERWGDAIALLEKSLGERVLRGDVTEDLARAYEHESHLDEAAALIDSRTFNQWEGQQSLHDIFETVHRRLGENAMKAKDYATAAREFQRSLEYPANIGAGKPKDKSQAEGERLLREARTALASQPAR